MAYQFQSAKIDFVYSGSVETTTQGLLQRKLMKIIPRWGEKKIKLLCEEENLFQCAGREDVLAGV